MSAKEDILKRIRSKENERFDKPSLEDLNPVIWDDPLAQFVSISSQVGGKAVFAPEDGNLDEFIRGLFPDAESFASNLPEIGLATVNPDVVTDVRELDGVDVGIVRGEVGVAENGCVWVPQTMKEKAACFICEHLVILLPREGIINNMHEAYTRIEFGDYGFGTFISGPSKTADIAQVLVMGAQAARSVTVILL